MPYSQITSRIHRIITSRTAFIVCLTLALICASPRAFATCSGPFGNAGDINYSSNQSLMVYCNGTSWVSMGSNSAIGFGTLTTNDFCTATSATNITCTTAGINLLTQVTGVLGGANGGTGVNNGAYTVTLGNNFATSGAYGMTLTAVGTTSVTLPTSGTLLATTTASPAQGDILYYNGSAWTDLGAGASGQVLQTQGAAANPAWATLSVGTGAISGTLTVPQGGTGDTTLTSNGVLLGNGTGNVNSTAAGATGTVLIGSTGGAPTFSATPSVTNMTVSGEEVLSFGTDYTTPTGAQNDVNVGAVSSMRFNGTSATTFEGIVTGTANVAGALLTIHNASTTASLTLADQSATTDSTLANRIITGTGSNLVMAANSSIVMQYDGTLQRWRVIGGSGGGVPAGTTGQIQFNSGSNNFAASANLSWNNTGNQLVAGTAAAAPVGLGTTGNVSTTVLNVIPQASVYTVTGAGGIITNTATTGQMAYYSAPNTISGTTNLYVSGSNIGIGTSTATKLLSLSGSAAQTLWMERGATIGNNLTVQAGGGVALGTNENGGNLILASGISTGTGTSQIQFQTYPAGSSGTTDNTATTRVTITGAGNVGIGTTSPFAPLEVFASTGAATLATSGTTDASTQERLHYGTVGLDMGILNGGPAYIQNRNVSNLATNYSLLLEPNGGNIGIGTTVPGAPLDVRASSDAALAAQIGGAGTPRIQFYGDQGAGTGTQINFNDGNGGSLTTANGSGGYIYIKPGNGVTPGTTFAYNGNVGIGTTVPNGKLTIANNVSSGGPAGAYGSYQVLLYDAGVANSSYGLGIEANTMWLNAALAYKFYIQGTAEATINNSGTYTAVSDRRLKTDIQPLGEEKGLPAVMRLNPVTFRWKDAIRQGLGEQMGFIAQDVQQVMPQLVTEVSDKETITLPDGEQETVTDTKGVAYAQIVVPLVKAVQELKSDNDSLRAANDDEAAQIKALTARLDALEAARH
jgi:hypothetical protein